MTIIGEILHKLSHCIDWTRRKVYPFDWCYMMYVVDKAATRIIIQMGTLRNSHEGLECLEYSV